MATDVTRSPLPLIVVLGATGTGKSQLAVEIAKHHNGEIINGDAMQLYEGLPIITNKITPEEQQSIPHHLLGVIGLQDDTWTVAQFRQRAGQIISEIRSRGKLPILVGGTHYYTQSLLFKNNLVVTEQYDGQKADFELPHQTELHARYPILLKPTAEILEELRVVDPLMAEQWHPNDRRKILRSLEIYLTTGRKASDIYRAQKERQLANKEERPEAAAENFSFLDSALLFWVYAEYDNLKQRLDTRVDAMVANGLMAEIAELNMVVKHTRYGDQAIDATRGICISIGFKEFLPYLEATRHDPPKDQSEMGKIYAQALDSTKAATRQYAKRQATWIRGKLWKSLAAENSVDKLYILDGTDVSSFDEMVARPARDIVARYLNDSSLPVPKDISKTAARILEEQRSGGTEEQGRIRKYCSFCEVTSLFEHEWSAHLKSRRHKRTLRKLEHQKQRKAWEDSQLKVAADTIVR